MSNDVDLFDSMFGKDFAATLAETGEERSLAFRARAVAQLEQLQAKKQKSSRGGWPSWQVDSIKQFIDTGSAKAELNGTVAMLGVARVQMYNIGKAVRNAYFAPAGAAAVGELYDMLSRMEIGADWPYIVLRKKPLPLVLNIVLVKEK